MSQKILQLSFTVAQQDNVSLQFRTEQRDGLLFYSGKQTFVNIFKNQVRSKISCHGPFK
jgi:hypothetical protein